MSLPETPNPFPTLKEGLALGASRHAGFVNVWNWLAGIMQKARDYFCLGINNRTGDVSVIGGDGIDVTTEGNTIMISLGSGQNTDNDEDGDGEDGGGEGGNGSGSGSGGGNGSGSGSGSWTVSSRPSRPGEPASKCNDWSEGAENGWEDGANNEGDNCKELNGW